MAAEGWAVADGATITARCVQDLEHEADMALLLGVFVRVAPSKDWLDQLAVEGVFDAIPYAANNEDVLRGQNLLSDWAQAWQTDGGDSFESICSDYMALFVGPGMPLAMPWESAHVHEGEALVFQKETLDVRRCYEEFGLQVEDLHHEPDDHIGYEMEFVAALARREADALVEGDDAAAERAARARASFVKEHLVPWVDGWTDLVGAHAKTSFFRGIALLFRGYLRVVA